MCGRPDGIGCGVSESGVLTWPLSHIRPHLGLNDAYTPAQVQSEVKMDVEGRPHDPSVWMMNITRWASDWYREGGWDRTVTSKETANVLCWMTNISETRSGCKWGWDSAWSRRSDIQDEPANCLGLMTNRPRSVYWDILRVRRPTPKCQGIINLMRSKNDLLLIWADQGRYGIPEFSGELRWACQPPGLNDEKLITRGRPPGIRNPPTATHLSDPPASRRPITCECLARLPLNSIQWWLLCLVDLVPHDRDTIAIAADRVPCLALCRHSNKLYVNSLRRAR